MSEISKNRIVDTKYYLEDAQANVDNAAVVVKDIGDKALVEKVTKIQSAITETMQYIQSRTGKGA